MIKLFDRVKVNIPTTGTGDIEFGAAASTAFLTPTEAGVLDGDEVRYIIMDGLDFEEGVGLIKDTVATMERTVTKSKIGGVVGTSAMNLSGTAVLALTASAADILTPSVYDPTSVAADAFDVANFSASGDRFLDVMPWYAIPPGGYYFADTSIVGASIPPQSHPDLVYIELTAGLTGSGGFNEGKLTGESVSGSFPLVNATAVIDVLESPIYGETIHLLNTEGRILRPSESSGTLQNDAMQGHRHRINSASSGVIGNAPNFTNGSVGSSSTLDTSQPIDDGVNGTPRTALETRMKNIGVTAYMRVK